MTHHHHEGECCDHHHHHDCCHSHEDCCHEESCCDAGQGESDFAHDLLELADEAWMCLLKEKIKANIASTSGAHLDKLAALVSEANKQRWDHKMAKHQVLEGYREKLAEFFHCKK